MTPLASVLKQVFLTLLCGGLSHTGVACISYLIICEQPHGNVSYGRTETQADIKTWATLSVADLQGYLPLDIDPGYVSSGSRILDPTHKVLRAQ